MQIMTVILFPLSILATLLGVGAKSVAHSTEPELATKYTYATQINVRSSDNFAGRLPPNPWTPNCVNSQQKSCWGELYNVTPIDVPPGLDSPLMKLKNLLATAAVPNFNHTNMTLVEEKGNYLHYTYTVEIPTGALKGTYIDDVDIYYNATQSLFDIRSASRVGFRDAVHFDLSLPGANKKRVEAIRQAWNQAFVE